MVTFGGSYAKFVISTEAPFAEGGTLGVDGLSGPNDDDAHPGSTSAATSAHAAPSRLVRFIAPPPES
jgi:hypothetical protein